MQALNPPSLANRRGPHDLPRAVAGMGLVLCLPLALARVKEVCNKKALCLEKSFLSAVVLLLTLWQT